LLQKKAEILFGKTGMNHKHLGNIPIELLTPIKDNIINSPIYGTPVYKIIYPNDKVVKYFIDLIFPKDFQTDDLKIHNIKAFVTPPEHLSTDGQLGCKYIHKDGVDKKCALNVVVECNPEDWVRWYTDEEILVNRSGTMKMRENPPELNVAMHSRDVLNIFDIENVPYVQELTNQTPGDFYLINTDVFHFFRNRGKNFRLIIQTKFAPNPSIEDLEKRIQEVGLNF
jgi:hypothetical protein